MATQAFDDNGSRWLQILHSKNCLLLTFTPGMPVTKGRPLGDVRDRLILIFATIGKLVFFGTRPTEGGTQPTPTATGEQTDSRRPMLTPATMIHRYCLVKTWRTLELRFQELNAIA